MGRRGSRQTLAKQLSETPRLLAGVLDVVVCQVEKSKRRHGAHGGRQVLRRMGRVQEGSRLPQACVSPGPLRPRSGCVTDGALPERGGSCSAGQGPGQRAVASLGSSARGSTPSPLRP